VVPAAPYSTSVPYSSSEVPAAPPLPYSIQRRCIPYNAAACVVASLKCRLLRPERACASRSYPPPRPSAHAEHGLFFFLGLSTVGRTDAVLREALSSVESAAAGRAPTCIDGQCIVTPCRKWPYTSCVKLLAAFSLRQRFRVHIRKRAHAHAHVHAYFCVR
jgi:hypothetical protein